tara:strand:- start:414 stop:677 length:264 start_codon:yes stop_codon:yes gene_type:complete
MTHDCRPKTATSQSQNNLPFPKRTLWDISTPEEVARSIFEFYPDDPMTELARRENYSRRQRQKENSRFWAEVRRLIEAQTGKGDPDE